jgi:hypothetical protein
MAVHERTATHFPTFTRAAAAAYREITSRYVATWCTAVAAFAAVSAAVTVGASYWRYLGDAAAHDAAAAARDRFNAASVASGTDWGTLPQVGPAALDLDTGAAIGQVLAATVAFGVLLAVALVLAAHGRTVAAYVAALVPAASIGLMAGPLAWTAPLVPVPSLDAGTGMPDQLTPAMRDAYAALQAVQVAQDTPAWWTWAIAAVAGVVALLAVHVARRGGVYDAHGIARTPLGLDVGVVVLVVGAVALLLGSLVDPETFEQAPGRDVRLLAVTVVIAVLAARAASASRIGTAIALSVGFGVAHLLLLAAFTRNLSDGFASHSGAQGGWAVGSSGPQVYASLPSVLVLVVTPVIAWIAGALWAQRVARRDQGSTTAAVPA